MKLSTRSRYGLRLLMEIARQDQNIPLPLKEAAYNQNISQKYLEKISRILKQNGYLEGKRGPQGGYTLGLQPHKIRLGDLIQDLEGNLDLVQCWMSKQACPRLQDCKTRSVWAELRRTIYDKLNTLTLKDLLDEKFPDCLGELQED